MEGNGGERREGLRGEEEGNGREMGEWGREGKGGKLGE